MQYVRRRRRREGEKRRRKKEGRKRKIDTAHELKDKSYRGETLGCAIVEDISYWGVKSG